MKRESGGSCARLAGWLLVAGLSLALVGAVGLGVVLWQQQADSITSLRRQVEELAASSRQSQEQLAAARATAVLLEVRLGELERTTPPAVVATRPAAATPVPDLPPEVVATQQALAGRVQALERQVTALATASSVASSNAGGVDPSLETDALAPGTLSPGTLPPGTLPPGTLPLSTPPPSVRLTVPIQRQRRNLSCESAAASMAARYHGVEASEADLLAALPRHDNPHLGFRGNVDGSPGGTTDYGVYATPIAGVLAGRGLGARMVAGGMAGIQAALARGNPVVAWITYDCLPGRPVTITVDGEQVVLVPYQHAVVVTGYDAAGVWVNDPWDGASKYYQAADFERALGYFDQMAIEVAARGD